MARDNNQAISYYSSAVERLKDFEAKDLSSFNFQSCFKDNNSSAVMAV